MELFRCCAGHGGVSICSLQPKQHSNIILVQTPRINGGCKYCPPAEQSLPSPLDLSSWTKLKPQLESGFFFFLPSLPLCFSSALQSAQHMSVSQREQGSFGTRAGVGGSACLFRGNATLCRGTCLAGPVLCKMEILPTAKRSAGSAHLLLRISFEEPMCFLAFKAEILWVSGVSSCFTISLGLNFDISFCKQATVFLDSLYLFR